RSEMDIRQSFLVVETLGDVLYFLQTAKGLLVSALHPQHLCLHDASVDPLPFSLVSLGKTVQTIDDRGAVAQSLGRGEPSCGPLRRPQQILKRLLIISRLLVVMTENLRLLVKSTQTCRLECTPDAFMMTAPRFEGQAFVRDLQGQSMLEGVH